ncbi:TonB-dependent receptor domain-containing protein [Algivirga pacifica]|uniref:TonB-dependent receptor n=1 Tax=Algivirga pacifica TaxID=1162670 RepID=A0ABP9D9U9_9BACT
MTLPGSEAVGGAVNFITYRAPADFSGKVSVQGDSYGYQRIDARVGTTINDRLGINVGGYVARRQDGFLDHSDFHKGIFTLALDYKLGDNTTLESNTTYMKYQSDMGSSVDSADFADRVFESQHTFTERTLETFRTKVQLAHQWNEQQATTATVYFRHNIMGQIPSYRIRNNWTNPAVATGEINEARFQGYGAVLQHKQTYETAAGKVNIRTGLSMDYSPTSNWAKFIEVERNEAGKYVGYTATDSLLTQYDVLLRNTGAYAQMEWKPVEKLQLVAALRYDHFHYDYNNHLGEQAFSGAPDAINTFQAWTPKLGLTYSFSERIGAYANYSRGMVPPQVSELYRGVQVPVLVPSLYDNYEAGGWFSLPQQLGFVDLSVYQLNGFNEIISVLQEDGSFQNENVGSTEHKGIEYTIKLFPIESLGIRFGGTHSVHRFFDFNNGVSDLSDNEMSAAPDFVGNAEVTYRPSFLPGARIALEWQRVGEYYMNDSNEDIYEGYHLFNLRAGYTWKGVELWANLMNVGDTMYATKAGKSSWGTSYVVGTPRNINVGVGYKF